MLPLPPHWTSSTPPGRSARASRAQRRSWSVTQCSVAVETIASTDSSRSRSSTSWHHTSARSPSRRCASATMSAEASTASTRPRGTSAASASVTRPVPQPTSSTVASGAMPSSRARTSEAHACCGSLDRSYVSASQGVPTAASGYRPGGLVLAVAMTRRPVWAVRAGLSPCCRAARPTYSRTTARCAWRSCRSRGRSAAHRFCSSRRSPRSTGPPA